jgi:hypothetical protein
MGIRWKINSCLNLKGTNRRLRIKLPRLKESVVRRYAEQKAIKRKTSLLEIKTRKVCTYTPMRSAVLNMVAYM